MNAIAPAAAFRKEAMGGASRAGAVSPVDALLLVRLDVLASDATRAARKTLKALPARAASIESARKRIAKSDPATAATLADVRRDVEAMNNILTRFVADAHEALRDARDDVDDDERSVSAGTLYAVKIGGLRSTSELLSEEIDDELEGAATTLAIAARSELPDAAAIAIAGARSAVGQARGAVARGGTLIGDAGRMLRASRA